MDRLATAMWTSLGLIAWTHVGYPVTAGLAASRSRYRPSQSDHLPSVALVIAAHNEEAVIGERLDNALQLSYPPALLQVVVSLDGSTDGTLSVVEQYASRGVCVLANPRRGKVAAQNAGVRATASELVAFSDANSMWEPDALRRLVRPFADPEVGYVCGRLRLRDSETGDNREGHYWRYELWLRAKESRLGSITAGNGAIYAVRRSAYPELPAQHSHDIALPFRLRRRKLRSLYVPAAVAVEPMAATSSAEWERKVRMLSRSWNELLRGGMLDPRGLPPLYFAELVSHRALRYAAGPLHIVLLATALRLSSATRGARGLAAAHVIWLAAAVSGRLTGARNPLGALAWYYLVVSSASVAGLVQVLREGPQVVWATAEGTR